MTHVVVEANTGNQLRSTVLRGLGATLLLHGFSITLAFAAYRYDFGVSSLPGQISIALALLCTSSPLVALLVFRNTRRFVVYGWVRLFNLLSAYALVGITFYYFYFIFAPISAPVHTIGLLVGGSLTLYWIWFSYRALSGFVTKSKFVEKAFSFSGASIQCDDKFFEILNKLYEEKNPFPAWHTWIVMGVAPFFLVLNRLLSTYFGSQGVLFFIAAITFPASLWLLGLTVRVFVIMIQLPLSLQKSAGKPVEISADAVF
ncbi:hypothetical protein PQR52_36930 [Paraburkholderia aspalathi]|uniref:hypothetical protein n=1 Tax=Paraburkholderia aspalathi TaxID=1324617 RepID=UPI0038BA98F9